MRTFFSSRWVLFFVIIVWMVGCKEDNPVAAGPTLTDDDIIDLIAGSIAGTNATNGLSVQLVEAATVAGGGQLGAQSITPHPGYQQASVDTSGKVDTTIMRQKTFGSYSYNYSFRYLYYFLSSDTFNFQILPMIGVYSTPRISGRDTASANISVTHILPPDSLYVIGGNYTRYGNQTLKIREKNTFYSIVGYEIDSVKISKATKRMKSGTILASIEIITSDGKDIVYDANAVLTILNSQLVRVVWNGKTYTIDLLTGNIL
jgi:hypothetical protein